MAAGFFDLLSLNMALVFGTGPYLLAYHLIWPFASFLTAFGTPAPVPAERLDERQELAGFAVARWISRESLRLKIILYLVTYQIYMYSLCDSGACVISAALGAAREESPMEMFTLGLVRFSLVLIFIEYPFALNILLLDPQINDLMTDVLAVLSHPSVSAIAKKDDAGPALFKYVMENIGNQAAKRKVWSSWKRATRP